MQLPIEVVRKFQAAIPLARKWIDGLLAEYAKSTAIVGRLQFPRISESFPKEFLKAAKMVAVTEAPRMPLEDFGLLELSKAMPTNVRGITFFDTYFVLEQFQKHEGLNFHELVHVAQWQRLGTDRFLMAYGIGLFGGGYKQSPLEAMAYGLQTEFERGKIWPNLVQSIEQRTDEIWKQVAAMLSNIM
jgi:hypothetical protein